MITDSTEIIAESNNSGVSKLLAVAVAVAISAILLAGYFYLRSRHAQRNAPAAVARVQNTPIVPKGPVKLHVLIDDPLLKGSDTLIGGTVKNISSEQLSGLTIELEFRRRNDGETENLTFPLDPATLGPEEEGRYTIKLLAQNYSGVRLVGLRASDGNLVAHSSSQGQRRPLEKTPSKTIVVGRPIPKAEEFINTPDNPGRVP